MISARKVPTYYAPRPPWFVHSEVFRESERSFVVVDGGSRGELFDPFHVAGDSVSVIAFDPAPDVGGGSRERLAFVPRALWKPGEEEIDFHLARDPSTSSVYPPDASFLDRFGEEVGVEPRETIQRLRIPAISLDRAVEAGLCQRPNFIKLDVHSSEFEALAGSRETLQHCVGVLVETWHHPVHEGQRLHGEVEAWLNTQGFFLAHLRPLEAWQIDLREPQASPDRGIQVVSETLFLPRRVPLGAELLAVATADLFGLSRYARWIVKQAERQETLRRSVAQAAEAELLRIARARTPGRAFRVARWGWRVAKAVMGV